MKTKLGNELNSEDRKYVLAAYVNRSTINYPGNGLDMLYIQFKDDDDWLANTYFRVRMDDRLDRRIRHCESHPTWPNNPELRG